MATNTDSTAPELDHEEALRLYQKMAEIRAFENRVMQLFTRNLVRGTTHLCQGQEAANSHPASTTPTRSGGRLIAPRPVPRTSSGGREIHARARTRVCAACGPAGAWLLLGAGRLAAAQRANAADAQRLSSDTRESELRCRRTGMTRIENPHREELQLTRRTISGEGPTGSGKRVHGGWQPAPSIAAALSGVGPANRSWTRSD